MPDIQTKQIEQSIEQLKRQLQQQALEELAELDDLRGFQWMKKEKVNRRLKGQMQRIAEIHEKLQNYQNSQASSQLSDTSAFMQELIKEIENLRED